MNIKQMGDKFSQTIDFKKGSSYSTVMIDSDQKEDFLSIQSHIKKLRILEIPTTEDLFSVVRKDIVNRKEVLFISKNQAQLAVAKVLGADTCFINQGNNDFIDMSPTYEVSSIKQLEDFKVKEKSLF